MVKSNGETDGQPEAKFSGVRRAWAGQMSRQPWQDLENAPRETPALAQHRRLAAKKQIQPTSPSVSLGRQFARSNQTGHLGLYPAPEFLFTTMAGPPAELGQFVRVP